MTKLFLTSAGLPKETREYFLNLLTKPPQETTIAFIPTAAHPAKDKSFVQKAKNEIHEIGMKMQEIDLVDENEQSLREKLSMVDVIYVNGGNTFYLLKCIRSSGFEKVVKEMISNGKVYVGSSAGSYVACPTIDMATWKHQDRERFDMTDFQAMQLVPFLVSAHYDPLYKDPVQKGIAQTSLPVVLLNDTQAVLCINNHYTIVGKGEKMMFNGFHET